MSKKRLEFLKDTFLGLDLQMADDEASMVRIAVPMNTPRICSECSVQIS